MNNNNFQDYKIPNTNYISVKDVLFQIPNQNIGAPNFTNHQPFSSTEIFRKPTLTLSNLKNYIANPNPLTTVPTELIDINSYVKPTSFQTQPLELNKKYISNPVSQQELQLTKNPIRSNSIKKFSTLDELEYRNIGKFTSKFFTEKNNNAFKFTVSDDSMKCWYHGEKRDNFLLEDCIGCVEILNLSGSGYQTFNISMKKNSRACQNCLTVLKSVTTEKKVQSMLYTDVIIEKKQILKSLKENKINLEQVTTPIQISECVDELDLNVYGIADEILDLAEGFEKDIICKFAGMRINKEELRSFQDFINTIVLKNNDEPDTCGIGDDTLKQKNYIQLSKFLIKFNYESLKEKDKNYFGISENFKSYIRRIFQLRKSIEGKLKDTLRFLLGDFYNFIFQAEKILTDEEFLNSFKIDYFSEVDNSLKYKIYYEGIIRQKDEEISGYINEIENNKKKLNSTKIEIDSNTNLRIEKIIKNYDDKISRLEQNLIDSKNKNERDISTNNLSNQNFSLLNREKDEIERKYQDLISIYNRCTEEADLSNGILRKYELRVRELESEKNAWNLNLSGYSGEILIIKRENDDLKNKLILLRNENEGIKIEMLKINNIRGNLDDEAGILRKKYEDLVHVYNNQKEDYENKFLLVKKLEGRILELEEQNSKMNNYEGIILNQQRKIEDLDFNLNSGKSEKDLEINRLRMKINDFQAQTGNNSHLYNELLLDLIRQLEIHDGLRIIIFDLQSRIDNHNLATGCMDNAIRHHIEMLTNQSLGRKIIDYSINNELMKNSQSEVEVLKNKIEKIESGFMKNIPIENIHTVPRFINTISNPIFSHYPQQVVKGREGHGYNMIQQGQQGLPIIQARNIIQHSGQQGIPVIQEGQFVQVLGNQGINYNQNMQVGKSHNYVQGVQSLGVQLQRNRIISGSDLNGYQVVGDKNEQIKVINEKY